MRDVRLAFAVAWTALTTLGAGCATTRVVEPLPVSPIRPSAGEEIRIQRTFVIVDASGSLAREFPDEKALVESFVSSMPDGDYQTGALAFGGEDRIRIPVERFDRAQLANHVQQIRHLDESTPLAEVFAEAGQALSGREGRTAIVLFSDGEPTTSSGVGDDPSGALGSAKSLAAQLGGRVCFHTVEIGAGSAGAALLEQIAELTPCGSFRAARHTTDVAAVERMSRHVFFGGELPAVGAAGDADRDGVRDGLDRCPGTPSGARVDARGCWVVPESRFDFDSAALPADVDPTLREVQQVLDQNPGLRLRVQGFADATGPEAYNVDLSRRRANTILERLTQAGLDAGRLEAEGVGEAAPAAPNDTRAHRRLNRRVELQPIR
jgi:OOP family OmpA-OmpF porin